MPFMMTFLPPRATAALLRREEWKELANFILVGLPPVFGDFKCFGVHDMRSVAAIPLLERLAPFRRLALRTATGEPLLPLRRIFWDLVQLSVVPGQPFIKLRYVGVEHIDLLAVHIVDRDHDVGPERIGLLEDVRRNRGTRGSFSARGYAARRGTVTMKWPSPGPAHPCSDGRDGNRLDGERGQCRPSIQPDFADDLLADCKSRKQFSVVIVQDVIFDSDAVDAASFASAQPCGRPASAPLHATGVQHRRW